MAVSLLVQNKTTGKIWDLSTVAENVTLTQNRTGSPATLKFNFIKASDVSFFEGDVVRFSEDGNLLFYGWVFVKSKNRWDEFEVTCYDKLRYLKNNASYAFYGQGAEDIIKQIAEDLQIPVSDLANTGYKIPSLVESDQSCLDIIEKAVQYTLVNTGRLYVFYDDGIGLCLREVKDMKSDVIIGYQSLLTDYDYKTDIDNQTYNYVKIARPNESTGRTDVFVAMDSENIGKWGQLMLYQSVDGDMNDAQLKAQAQATLEYYNQRQRTLKLSSLGVSGLRAGQVIYVNIPAMGDVDFHQYVLVDKITHTYEQSTHTMEIETINL